MLFNCVTLVFVYVRVAFVMSSDDLNFDLTCPEGTNFHEFKTIQNLENRSHFSICVSCKNTPTNHQQVDLEVCLANIDEVLDGKFKWGSKTVNQCTPTQHCGLHFSEYENTLESILEEAECIDKCTGNVATISSPTSSTILKCPQRSHLIGMEHFVLKQSKITSALCGLNSGNKQFLVSVYAYNVMYDQNACKESFDSKRNTLTRCFLNDLDIRDQTYEGFEIKNNNLLELSESHSSNVTSSTLAYIVPSAFFCLLFIAVTGAIMFFLCKKKKGGQVAKKEKEPSPNDDLYITNNPYYGINEPSSKVFYLEDNPYYDDNTLESSDVNYNSHHCEKSAHL